MVHRDVTVFFLCTLASCAAFSIAFEDPDDAPERATCTAVRFVLCMFSSVEVGFEAMSTSVEVAATHPLAMDITVDARAR